MASTHSKKFPAAPYVNIYDIPAGIPAHLRRRPSNPTPVPPSQVNPFEDPLVEEEPLIVFDDEIEPIRPVSVASWAPPSDPAPWAPQLPPSPPAPEQPKPAVTVRDLRYREAPGTVRFDAAAVVNEMAHQLRNTTLTDPTDAMAPADAPTTVRNIVNAFQKARAVLPKSTQQRQEESLEVAQWLRNNNFCGLDDNLHDIVLRPVGPTSGKLPKRGIQTRFGWMDVEQVKGLTELLSVRYKYQAFERWIDDERSLTASVYHALYPGKK